MHLEDAILKKILSGEKASCSLGDFFSQILDLFNQDEMGFDDVSTDLRQDDADNQDQEEDNGPYHGTLKIEHENNRDDERKQGDDLDHLPSLQSPLGKSYPRGRISHNSLLLLGSTGASL
jgi:hypothetical protein